MGGVMPALAFRDLFIEVTGRCNLRCCHCFRPECEEIDVPVEEVVHRMCRVRAKNIVITGGEPTLHPNLRQIIGVAKERVGAGGKVILITNAAGWSEDTVLTLCEADVVNVSLDWADDRHDENRGRIGLCEEAGRLIDQLASMTTAHMPRPKINLLVTMFRENMNIDNINAIIRFARDHGVDDVVFDRYVPCHDHPTPLTIKGITATLRYLDDLGRGAKAPEALPQITVYEVFANVVHGHATPRSRCRGRIFCDIHGRWSLCPFYPARFDDIVEAVREREREPIPGACIGCEHSDTCHGGCPATRLVACGTLEARDPLCPLGASHYVTY